MPGLSGSGRAGAIAVTACAGRQFKCSWRYAPLGCFKRLLRDTTFDRITGRAPAQHAAGEIGHLFETGLVEQDRCLR
jgi:hypothetical protein